MMRSLGLSACVVLAACGGASNPGPSLVPLPPPPVIAVIGDSISKVAIMPDSVIPCGAGYTTNCDYSTDGSQSYPTVIATQTGDTVVNLSSPGCRTTESYLTTVPVIDQVPNIPSNTTVVVWESGTNDTSAHGVSSAYNDAISAVAAAIRARVPKAKLIVLGVRYYNNAVPPRVDAWNALLQGVPGVTFIDLRPLWANGVSASWPDGTHPAISAVPTIAASIERLL